MLKASSTTNSLKNITILILKNINLCSFFVCFYSSLFNFISLEVISATFEGSCGFNSVVSQVVRSSVCLDVKYCTGI